MVHNLLCIILRIRISATNELEELKKKFNLIGIKIDVIFELTTSFKTKHEEVTIAKRILVEESTNRRLQW